MGMGRWYVVSIMVGVHFLAQNGLCWCNVCSLQISCQALLWFKLCINFVTWCVTYSSNNNNPPWFSNVVLSKKQYDMIAVNPGNKPSRSAIFLEMVFLLGDFGIPCSCHLTDAVPGFHTGGLKHCSASHWPSFTRTLLAQSLRMRKSGKGVFHTLFLSLLLLLSGV